MSFHSWLQNLRSIVAPRRGQPHHGRRGSLRAATHRPHLEVLEDRCLLSFSPITSFPAGIVGTNPQAVATADFNNDGKLDLATTLGYSVGRVSIRLGDGAGGFGTAQEIPLGWGNPSSIAVADFNRDARLDILVAHLSGFSILMGNGDGTFQSAATTPVGSWGLSAVAVLDYHNGNIDLVAAWYNADFMHEYGVYVGNGQGGFAGPTNVDLMHTEGGLATVDLNNDGRLDMATVDGRVLLGYGGGFLFPDGQQPPLPSGRAVATGDFTGEGNADLVVAGDSVLAVLRGRGDGYFDAPILHSAYGTVHTAVATADFNADGKLDAVVTDSDQATVSVMLSNGDGTLRFGGAFAAGTSPAAVVVGDFNGDGRTDVAVANAGSNTVSVLLNDGDWATIPPPPPTLSIADTTVTEGDTGALNATFTVTLTRPAAADVTVHYDMVNINATAATDYIAAPGTLTIPAGETSGTFTVAIRGDRLAEPTETFAVNLSNSTNAAIADAQGLCTIVDNEPRISISDVAKAEGKNRQTTLFTFTVTLMDANGQLVAYDQAVTMSFRTADGTAKTSDGDYIAKTGTLTFAPGETTKTITIEVKGDSKKEANETFYLDLFGPSSNALFTKNRGLGTILNDD